MLALLRPDPEGTHDAQMLSAAGIQTLSLPMLEIQPRLSSDIAAKIEQASHLVFTSQQAIRILSEIAGLDRYYARKPCFCVGHASRLAARKNAMKPIESDGRNGAELADQIIAKLGGNHAQTDVPRLLWLSGAQVQFDMQAPLLAHHINIEREIIYQAVRIASLSPQTISLIDTGQIGYVVALSAGTLEHFQQLLTGYGLWHHHKQMHLIAASEKMVASIDAEFATTSFVDMTAKNRYIDQLIDIINRLASH